MNQDFAASGIILFAPKSFENIHNSLYEQILSHLIATSDCDVADADNFVLDFFEVFENSKKMIVFEPDKLSDN